MMETIEIPCRVTASPDADSFRWASSPSDQDEGVPIDPNQFTADPKESRLRVTPTSLDHFGTLACWASNALGEQERPCLFRLVEGTHPGAPENCTSFSNFTESSVFVRCVEGDDGGLSQRFVAQVVNRATMRVVKNVTNDAPYFEIDELPPGTDFLLTIYAANARGRSEVSRVQARTSRKYILVTFEGGLLVIAQHTPSALPCPIANIGRGLDSTRSCGFLPVCGLDVG